MIKSARKRFLSCTGRLFQGGDCVCRKKLPQYYIEENENREVFIVKESKLFSVLPEYICTPGGMAIDRAGNLVLSCPNYAREDGLFYDVVDDPESFVETNLA